VTALILASIASDPEPKAIFPQKRDETMLANREGTR
jgi:hypothetical protein